MEAWFYHLERASLDQTVPPLLQKCLERDWRVALISPRQERLAHLDNHLWTWRDDSWLPHGQAGGEHDSLQPVLLSCDAAATADRDVAVLLDQARLASFGSLKRAIIIFNGNDEEELSDARFHWKSLKDEGLELSYWQQEGRGWAKKA